MSHSGVLEGRALVGGNATGRALVLTEPLSFWGGLEPSNGEIIDRRHPQCGECITRRVLVMPSGRGSSSSSTVLAEAIRLRTAPSAIILAEPDSIIVIGALVARELYALTVPVVLLNANEYVSIENGETLSVEDGRIERIN